MQLQRRSHLIPFLQINFLSPADHNNLLWKEIFRRIDLLQMKKLYVLQHGFLIHSLKFFPCLSTLMYMYITHGVFPMFQCVTWLDKRTLFCMRQQSQTSKLVTDWHTDGRDEKSLQQICSISFLRFVFLFRWHFPSASDALTN